MHIKEVDFTNNMTDSIICYQYDFGQLVRIISDKITEGHTIQWSYNGIDGVDSRAITKHGEELCSQIPNDALKTVEAIKGYIYYFDSEKGNTTNVINLTVIPRASTDEHTSEDDIPVYQQLILDVIESKEEIEANAVLYDDIVIMEKQSDGSIKIRRETSG